jgi:hypothetical protein
MSDKRTPRDAETRDVEKRDMAWQPSAVLPEPVVDEGYVARWIRTSMMGKEDTTNVSSKIREGWIPCKAKDHPEFQLFTVDSETFKDNVLINGLLLCMMPKELFESRQSYYQNQATGQMKAVDSNLMNENDPRTGMQIFNDRQTRVTFGNGN